MAFLTVEYYEQIKDYLNPHLSDNIYHYRKGNFIELPPYQGCTHVNRNGTRRYIDYSKDINTFVQLKSIIGKKTKDYLHYTETVKNRTLTNE